MLFRTHFFFGLFVYFCLDCFIEMPFFVLIFVLVGAVFVDLDSSSSKVGGKFSFLSWCFKHRGVLHSLIASLFLGLIVGVFSLWGGFGFFVGYLSHLILVCFSKMGVKLFWPLDIRVKGFIKSGGWIEDILFVLLLGVDVLLILRSCFE